MATERLSRRTLLKAGVLTGGWILIPSCRSRTAGTSAPPSLGTVTHRTSTEEPNGSAAIVPTMQPSPTIVRTATPIPTPAPTIAPTSTPTPEPTPTPGPITVESIVGGDMLPYKLHSYVDLPPGGDGSYPHLVLGVDERLASDPNWCQADSCLPVGGIEANPDAFPGKSPEETLKLSEANYKEHWLRVIGESWITEYPDKYGSFDPTDTNWVKSLFATGKALPIELGVSLENQSVGTRSSGLKIDPAQPIVVNLVATPGIYQGIEGISFNLRAIDVGDPRGHVLVVEVFSNFSPGDYDAASRLATANMADGGLLFANKGVQNFDKVIGQQTYPNAAGMETMQEIGGDSDKHLIFVNNQPIFRLKAP